MTFDLLKYSEDRISVEASIPDELLGDALSIIIASADTELRRDGVFQVTVTEEEVVRALGEVNLPDVRERVYGYCEGLGVDVDTTFSGIKTTPSVELTWTVQSLKNAKVKAKVLKEKEDIIMYNSEGEPLLPLGSIANLIDKHDPENPLVVTIVSHLTLGETHTDYYEVERNGKYKRAHYSEVC